MHSLVVEGGVGAAEPEPGPLTIRGALTDRQFMTHPDDVPGAARRWLLPAGWVLVTTLAMGIALFAVSLETHFDCGGTLGGYGESASARLDEDCVDARRWRVVVVPGVIAATSAASAIVLSRLRARGSFTGRAPLLLALGLLVVVWGMAIATFVAV